MLSLAQVKCSGESRPQHVKLTLEIVKGITFLGNSRKCLPKSISQTQGDVIGDD
ncbi:hypothetical protein BgiBS90_003056, partial [Biomphalaria glabrata]